MSLEGMGASLAVVGSTTAAIFEVYVEKVSLRAYDVDSLW